MMTTYTVLVSILLLFLALSGACLRKELNLKLTLDKIGKKYHVVGKYIKDKQGRVRIFHGFNAVTKSPPWYPIHLLNETRLRLYRDWGLSVVRLGTMWAGAQPNERYFNQTYLNQLTTIVDKLNEYGIDVILDLHQDVLSSAFGSYDGVPLWFIKKLPPAEHAFPWPLTKEIQWSDGYLTEATSQAFQALYSNKADAWKYIATFWQRIAKLFRHHNNILGYEFINEPWVGNIYHDLSLFLPGVAGRKNLKPLYDHLNAAIRSVDPNSIIFYEPVTWGILFNDSTIGSGFSSVPGGDAFRDRSCLSYHYYCWALTGNQHSHYKTFTRSICDKELGPQVFSAVEADISQTGGSSFLTEFGLCDPDGSSNSTATVECTFIMQQADQHLQSWTYWDGGFFNDTTGGINSNIVTAFSRVYARAIAGIPIRMHYEPQSRVFELCYQLEQGVDSVTEIVIPTWLYPNSFRVRVSVGIKWYFDVATHVLEVWKASGHKKSGVAMVTVKPL